MNNLTNEDKILLASSHEAIANDTNIQKAISDYIEKHELTLPRRAVFEWGIDCVGVFVDTNLVLSVGLPPVSNYTVRETEHTRQYLRKKEPIAV